MDREQLLDRVCALVEETYALEAAVERNLEALAGVVDDPVVRGLIERHRAQTAEHEARLADRLKALGGARSPRRQTVDVPAGLLKRSHDDSPSRLLRIAYVAEHAEIAAYEVLRRAAHETGDEDTAAVAALNLSDEREMARDLEEHWGSVLARDRERLAPGRCTSGCPPGGDRATSRPAAIRRSDSRRVRGPWRRGGPTSEALRPGHAV